MPRSIWNGTIICSGDIDRVCYERTYYLGAGSGRNG